MIIGFFIWFIITLVVFYYAKLHNDKSIIEFLRLTYEPWVISLSSFFLIISIILEGQQYMRIKLREVQIVYCESSTVYRLYNQWLDWSIKRDNAFRKKKRERITRVCRWKATRLNRRVFLDNPRCVWVQSCKQFGKQLTVTFLEEV